MEHPLDGARLKVVRAQEHLVALKLEIAAYIGTSPYDFVHYPIVPVERDGAAWHTKFNVNRHPDLHISATIGDCISNARSALDYIAWALAVKFSPRVLIPGKNRIYFPIWDDFVRGERDIERRFARYRIPAAAIDEIKRAQPYRTGGILPYGQPLWILQRLVNGDKHRLPTLTCGSISTTSVTISVPRNIPTNSPSEPVGKLVVSWGLEGQATAGVSFDDVAVQRDPVDRTLENIVKCVANIVPRFNKFFS